MPRPDRFGMTLLLATVLALGGCATMGASSSDDGMHRADTPSTRENAARLHTELGRAYMARGELKAALAKLQTALSFDPDYAPAHTVLGALYSRLGEVANAEAHYRRAVELKPKDGDTNNNFGQFLCQEGKVDEAMPYFKKALADPFYQTRPLALTNAGVCQLRAHDYAQAQTYFASALRLDPKYPDALYEMASVLYTQGDAFHASAFVQRYQALGHPSAAVLKLGYDIATRLGNAEEAQDYARQLRSKFPDSEQAQALDTPTQP